VLSDQVWPEGRKREEHTMKKTDHPDLAKQAKWVLGAFGIVLAYFGAFAVLMYPVVEASTRMA
jgi:hypothetical protein